jgi:hypothetical protein
MSIGPEYYGAFGLNASGYLLAPISHRPSSASLPTASSSFSLQHYLVPHDHVPNQPILDLGELLDPIAEAVVRDDARVQLAGKRKKEIVGVGPGRA